MEYNGNHFFSLWRGMYFRFENDIHPRETYDDLLLVMHDHTSCLEDHVKLLVKVEQNLNRSIIRVIF